MTDDVFLQVWSPCMLPGSSGAGFISSGLRCVLGSLAAAGSVHVQGVHQCQRQGKRHILFKSLTSSITVFFCAVPHDVWLTVELCLWTAVLLVDTSRSEPERQHHGSPRAVCPRWSVTSVRSFLPAVASLTTTPGNPLTTRITQIFPSTGQQGISYDFLPFLSWGETFKSSPLFCRVRY